jgi:hypothetical protein
MWIQEQTDSLTMHRPRVISMGTMVAVWTNSLLCSKLVCRYMRELLGGIGLRSFSTLIWDVAPDKACKGHCQELHQVAKIHVCS